MLDRVERSDVLNATALAAVLLFLGIGLVRLVGWFGTTVDEGLWEAEAAEDVVGGLADPGLISLRPPNEVTVLVGNGSEGRNGLAGQATRRLNGEGYGTLDPLNKDGEPIDDSFVYYVDDYKVEAIQIANLLNIPEAQVRPLFGDLGLPTEAVDVLVVLGQNADF